MRVKPIEIIADYIAAFEAANKMNEAPHMYHAGGWYTLKSPRSPPKRYRRAEIVAMTERLRERAALSPPSQEPAA